MAEVNDGACDLAAVKIVTPGEVDGVHTRVRPASLVNISPLGANAATAREDIWAAKVPITSPE
jgi:hypothetical protein